MMPSLGICACRYLDICRTHTVLLVEGGFHGLPARAVTRLAPSPQCGLGGQYLVPARGFEAPTRASSNVGPRDRPFLVLQTNFADHRAVAGAGLCARQSLPASAPYVPSSWLPGCAVARGHVGPRLPARRFPRQAVISDFSSASCVGISAPFHVESRALLPASVSCTSFCVPSPAPQPLPCAGHPLPPSAVLVLSLYAPPLPGWRCVPF
ncbi:hypothetical protein BDW62DRAFT_178946 [Aspergillus aurantiobrunneus]